jgi:large subunit ribosomal protein L15
LTAAGLIRGSGDGVRILAKGEIKASLTFEVAGVTTSAFNAIEKAGGKVILPEPSKVDLVSQEKSKKSAAKKLAAKPIKKEVVSDEGNIKSTSEVAEDSKIDE